MSPIKRNLLIVFGLFGILAFGFSSLPASAASALDGQIGLDQVSQSYGGANRDDVKDVRSIVAQVINAATMLLGAIFVVLIIVAGYLYMTSAGNEKQIDKSMSYIKTGVIGLIIVLMAWSITAFVMKGGSNTQEGGLLKATGTDDDPRYLSK